MALCRIPRAEIAQWERDEGISLKPWQRHAILLLDEAFVAAMSPRKSK